MASNRRINTLGMLLLLNEEDRYNIDIDGVNGILELDSSVMLLQRADGKKFDFKNGATSIKSKYNLSHEPNILSTRNALSSFFFYV
jgi:hypothetical protein